MAEKPLNELMVQAEWAERMYKKFLERPFKQSYGGGVVSIPFNTLLAKFLQLKAGVDVLVQKPDGSMIGVDIKLVRWPCINGHPRHKGWHDFFLEMVSCSVPGYWQDGWFVTSRSDVLLWGQVTHREDEIECTPLLLPALRAWFAANQHNLVERIVPNVINGLALNTIGRLAPIGKVCEALHAKSFRVTPAAVYTTLLGDEQLNLD